MNMYCISTDREILRSVIMIIIVSLMIPCQAILGITLHLITGISPSTFDEFSCRLVWYDIKIKITQLHSNLTIERDFNIRDYSVSLIFNEIVYICIFECRSLSNDWCRRILITRHSHVYRMLPEWFTSNIHNLSNI